MTRLAVSTKPGLRVLGVDVAKRDVVLFDAVSNRTLRIANDATALRRALAAFADRDLVVCETTGGFERALCDAAGAVGLPIHRADAAKVKSFVRSHGGRAKTDPIDARWLARYGLERGAGLPQWRAPEPSREALADLARHRQDLVADRARAKNRRSAPGATAATAQLLEEQVAFLDGQIRRLDAVISETMAEIPDLKETERALRAIPGIGPVVAAALLALMPELGALTRRQAASLAGLAPHPDQSGERERQRRVWGGRAGLRPLLFMAALSAARAHPRLKIFYERLTSEGKPKRLVLTAIARKLVVIANAVIRDRSAAQPQT